MEDDCNTPNIITNNNSSSHVSNTIIICLRLVRAITITMLITAISILVSNWNGSITRKRNLDRNGTSTSDRNSTRKSNSNRNHSSNGNSNGKSKNSGI